MTGERIADRFIAAAESGAQGGFLLYHFDDPADDTDSADIPKVSYARRFNGNIPLPDGGTTPASFIINSGFYLTSDGEYVQRILEALQDGQTSILFAMTTPEDGDVLAGDAVAVSATGAPTDTVHFAYRPAGLPEEAFTWLGAAPNRDSEASFIWDTLDLPDDDYELVALYTEDDGDSVIYDAIEVSVDNVGGGGGGCGRGGAAIRRRRPPGPHAARSCRAGAGLPAAWMAACGAPGRGGRRWRLLRRQRAELEGTPWPLRTNTSATNPMTPARPSCGWVWPCRGW